MAALVRSSRMVRAGLLATALGLLVAASASAAPPAPALLVGAIGEGASDVNAFFSGSVRGIVTAAVLTDGSVRVRTMVRGADASRSYRVVGSGSPCGDPIVDRLLLLPSTPLMGAFVSKTHAAGSLPDRTGVLVSIRILRAGGGQIACAEALSYEPAPATAGPALTFTDIVISSYVKAGGPRGLLVTNAPDSANPQLRWSLTGLSGVSSFRVIGSAVPCGTPSTSGVETFRSDLLTKPYGFTEVTGLDIQTESFRIVSKAGRELGCTGRGRHVQPLF